MSQTPNEKIALFGGSFDPVHLGHIAIAEAAHAACDLDRVVFLPCWQSPHKSRGLAAPEHRAAMLELATSGSGWAEVSTWELERDTASYSWVTAEHFAGQHPAAELFWILGTDQWDVLGTWSKPERLAELLTFIVFPRGAEVAPSETFRNIPLDVRHPASSTDAREKIRAGESTAGTLYPEVRSYIDREELYA